jgi:hypothetical protein
MEERKNRENIYLRSVKNMVIIFTIIPRAEIYLWKVEMLELKVQSHCIVVCKNDEGL